MPLTSGDTTNIHRMICNLMKRILPLSKSSLSIQNVCVFKKYFLVVFLTSGTVLLKSNRFWKWAAAHVCRNKNRSTNRTTTPFVCADTHGPKEVFQSKFWILKWFENFFHALQVGLRCSSKSFFLHVVSADFLCKFLNYMKTCKNHYLRTFVVPKTNWCCF